MQWDERYWGGQMRAEMKLRTNDAGFTLVEMLVALVILTIGLLGVAALQIQAMKYNTDAYLRTQATTLAYDIADRMRANKEAANLGLYGSAAAPAGTIPDCNATACTSAEMALFDMSSWYTTLPLRLPTPTASILSVGNTHTITIGWSERELPVEHTWVIVL